MHNLDAMAMNLHLHVLYTHASTHKSSNAKESLASDMQGRPTLRTIQVSQKAIFMNCGRSPVDIQYERVTDPFRVTLTPSDRLHLVNSATTGIIMCVYIIRRQDERNSKNMDIIS